MKEFLDCLRWRRRQRQLFHADNIQNKIYRNWLIDSNISQNKSVFCLGFRDKKNVFKIKRKKKVFPNFEEKKNAEKNLEEEKAMHEEQSILKNRLKK